MLLLKGFTLDRARPLALHELDISTMQRHVEKSAEFAPMGQVVTFLEVFKKKKKVRQTLSEGCKGYCECSVI